MPESVRASFLSSPAAKLMLLARLWAPEPMEEGESNRDPDPRESDSVALIAARVVWLLTQRLRIPRPRGAELDWGMPWTLGPGASNSSGFLLDLYRGMMFVAACRQGPANHCAHTPTGQGKFGR